MEIADVMRVCQELAQRVVEQKSMAYEDDRSRLIQQFAQYQRRNDATVQFMHAQIDKLRVAINKDESCRVDESESPTTSVNTPSKPPHVANNHNNVVRLPKSSVRKPLVPIISAQVVQYDDPAASNAVIGTNTSNNKRTHTAAFNKDKNTSDHSSVVALKGGYVYSNRSREKRSEMPADVCTECARYYEAMKQQGICTSQELKEHVQSCSRHRVDWVIPQTPEHFWDLSVHTPEEWKQQDRR